ncbi:hypothetical protein K504DRAFT_447889 [Pleomassaria siparia CBS 279.74]|uniref:Rhodopsin domain-containing protein n=1 Tax=Pleomassaria siparia CBS 279.74 TaxID=1314801 RepID=A0A6G1K126_9PLEO|nr:hypothetical protein K504DRAFT_447889 [Pleomassaria siparia CBS 279.74]
MKGGGQVMAVAILFFVLTYLTVGLRVYVRGFMLNSWGRDDYAIIVTLGIFTVYLACQIVAAIHGTGQHRWELDDHDAQVALLFWYLCELLYVLSNCTLKIALGVFYLRVAQKPFHIWCIRLLMAGTVLFGSVYLFLVMFQCVPVSEFWLNHPSSAKCIPEGPTIGITYALGAVNAFADWAFGLLPFFIVWHLRMNIRTKMLVAGILAFAAIGSTATVVRMQYIRSLTNGPDFLWATKDVAIWSTVEPGIGITASSMATLRPLLQSLMHRLGLAAAPASARVRTPSRPSRPSRIRSVSKQTSHMWLGLSDLVPTQGSTSTTITSPASSPMPHMEWTSSRNVISEMATPPERGGINKSVVVEQEFEGPPRLHLTESPRNGPRNGPRNSVMRGSVFFMDSRARDGDGDQERDDNLEQERDNNLEQERDSDVEQERDSDIEQERDNDRDRDFEAIWIDDYGTIGDGEAREYPDMKS